MKKERQSIHFKINQMGVPAYNLVIVKGDKSDLEQFEKLAYKNDSNAIVFEQLLPFPPYLGGENENPEDHRAYRHVIYGSNWVAAFGVLIDKNNAFLKYFFNSKWTKAQFDFVAVKYDKLSFTHVYREIADDNKFGVIEYENGERVSEMAINVDNIDWGIVSKIHTCLYLEELWLKVKILNHRFPQIIDEITWPEWPTDRNNTVKYNFFTVFPKIDFLRDYKSYYDSIYQLERDLEAKDIDEAINQPGYPLIISTLDDRLRFIDQNYLPSDRKSQMIKDVLDGLNASKRVTDRQVIGIYGYLYQNRIMTEWLYSDVKKFLTNRTKRMKLYLKEAANPETKLDADRKWFPILGRPQYDVFINKEDFLEWPGLEKEQDTFWNLRKKVDAILLNPDVPSYENEDCDLPF